jgi:arylsulfatase A-like enzyme/Flp pilus assembly protein TadD
MNKPSAPVSRRRRVWMLALLVIVVASGLYGWRSVVLSRRPNVLLITLDTTRADRIGCYGYRLAETPHLDALAHRGVRFERAYAPAPMTSPSHTSLMTGLWPPEHGVYTNGQMALASEIPTAAALLQQRGYNTAAFVAAFVLQAKFGLNQGFLVYDDDLSTADTGGDVLHRYRDGRHVVDSAIDWLTKQQKLSATPFFCWVHLYDPHDPYLAHEDVFGDRFVDRPYDGELAYIDRQVGRLLDALVKLGMMEHTVIVVVGDHGESLGEHGEETHGYMLHESTLRVPLIIAEPRRPTSGQRVPSPVSLVDVFPTLLELGRVSPQEESAGRSLKPALDGKSLAPHLCYSQTEEPYLQAFWSPLQGLTTDRWRYVRTSKPELYDLADDPQELHNLAPELPDRVAELSAKLAELEARFQRRSASHVTLSGREQRALESLGYAAGGPHSQSRQQGRSLPDIKDMIGHLNQLQHGTRLLDDGKFEEAATLLEPLARDVPNFLRARLNLGLCQIKLRHFDDAVRWLESALEVDPDSDRAHDMLGFANLKLGKLEQAEEHFQRLLELRPDSEHGHLFLGEVCQRRQQFPLAIRHYEEALRINPGSKAAREALEALTPVLSPGARP